jgi:TetR/AcrR family transcriptional regulator
MTTEIIKLRDKSKKVIQERRKREKDSRIESILRAAKNVFYLKGYMKATMDEIALEAEITKPTIYKYFKTKDDLFFSLITPVMVDIRENLTLIEKNLEAGKIQDGRSLIRAIFKAFYQCFESSPDSFRIIQLFHLISASSEMEPNVRDTLNEMGKDNFIKCRSLLTKSIELGLIKKVNVFELADLLWSLLMGVIQLEDSKGDDQNGHKLKKKTLRLAEQLVADSLKNIPS